MNEKLRVLIADDEPMVCVVVKKCIYWEKLGLELAGVASDGQELMDLIKKEKPDIVITDISMPELSGLDLIETVRKEGAACRFIIISGYRQFEYARKALKNSVDDYLLKPINEQEINESLERLRASILDEKMHGKKVVDTLKADIKKDRENINRMFLMQMLEKGSAFLEDAENVKREYGLELGSGIYQAIEAKFDILAEEDSSAGLSSIQNKLVNIFKKIFEKESREIFVLEEAQRLLIGVNYDSAYKSNFFEKCQKFYEYGKNIVELFVGFTLTVGISAAHETLLEFPQAFKEAGMAVDFRLTLGTDQTIFYDKITIPDERWSDEEMAVIRETVARDFEGLDQEHFRLYTNSLFFPGNRGCNASEMVKLCNTLVEIFYKVQERFEETLDNADYWKEAALKRIENSVSLSELKEAVLQSVLSAMEILDEKRKNQKKRPVRAVIQYIEEHYQETLTLEKVAEAVNLNPVYLSNIFRKETNEKFVDYVHKRKIEAAKQMLCSEDTSVVNIAETLGYFDSKYFSKIFRKYVGIKPTDYRNIYGCREK